MPIGQKWTNKGQEFAIDQLDDNFATASPTYFGHWGNNATTPAVTDTTLLGPNDEDRTAIPAGSQTQPATDTIRFVYTIIATGSRTVQETGIFSTAGTGTPKTGGDLYIRIVHGSLALESGDQVTYTVNLRLKDDSEA